MEPRIYPDTHVAVWTQGNSPRVTNSVTLTSPLVPLSIKSFLTLPIKAANFDSRELSIAPESPKPTVFLDGKGNLFHNQPSGQQEYQSDIPNSGEKRTENVASEPSHRNAVVVNNDDGDDEILHFKSKATQARKRAIVISDDEGEDKGIGCSLRSMPTKLLFSISCRKRKAPSANKTSTTSSSDYT